MRKITLEQKKKAVEIALAGGNPLPYLKECGSKKPESLWYTIKQNVKAADPETFEKLPERIGAKLKEPEAVKDYEITVQGEPIKWEAVTEGETIQEELPDEDELQVESVVNRLIGRFHLSLKFEKEDLENVLVWNSPYGDEVMMDAEHWWKLAELLPKVLRKLKIDKQEGEI